MTQRVMISMPEDFAKLLDELAEAEHRSRSELIREAVRYYAEHKPRPRQGRPIDDPKVQAALEHMRYIATKWTDPGDSVQFVHEAREARYRRIMGLPDLDQDDEPDR